MGHQITAGDEEIAFTAGAWQVVFWCDHFTPKKKPQGMSDRDWADQLIGVTDVPADAVVLADQKVPKTFEEAQAAGLIRPKIDEGDFETCRAFLSYAANGKHEISGSW